MNKTILRNIQLVNWYGFINRRIPVSENLTLISGENECGKSTILDAVKYAYTGDTQFNKATSGYNTGVGKRNLVSYTRCLIDASAGIYGRPADKMPMVYTHIALEYYDQINENPFVLGVVIETGAADVYATQWYAVDGKTLEDLEFVYEENGVWKPCDANGFRERNGVRFKTKKEGLTLFMQMVGLKLPYQEISKYQRKLRNIMAYNPAAKIQEFIKESVLEEHNVNFDKLKDAKKNIEQINHSLEQIEQELRDLDAILHDYDEYDRTFLRLKIDDIKVIYKNVIDCRNKRQQITESINENKINCEELGKAIEKDTADIEELEQYYQKAKNALLELDVSRTIDASKQQIQNYKHQLEVLEKEKQELETFQTCVQELANVLGELGDAIPDVEMAERLTARSVSVAEKKKFIDVLKEMTQKNRDALIKKNAYLERQLEDVQKECTEQNRIIESCNKSRADYGHAAEQMQLIAEINREFKKRNINDTARLACEYVAALKDEEWRDAIEAFLGVHRYAIIVSPAAFDVANEVMDQSGHRYVELVNTRRLMERKESCEEDAVYYYLQIENEIAAKYFQFWLGRIHAVKKEDVPNYDNAMSKEGKLSRNMAVTYINVKKIKSYCLGSEAIELNKQRAERKLHQLEQQEKELLEESQGNLSRITFLQERQEDFKEYNLDAYEQVAKVTADLNEENSHYQELLEAQRNNREFITLNGRVTELEDRMAEKKKKREKQEKEKMRLETDSEAKLQQQEELEKRVQEEQKRLDEEQVSAASAVETAIREYDGYLSGDNRDGGLMKRETKERNGRRVRELEGNINGQQQMYNNRKQEADKLPIGLEYESYYQKRRGKIWIDDLQGIQKKLSEQTRRYENIFKREFVLGIYEMAKDARADIADINKELRKLQFATRYQFDVKLVNDGSDYARILRYAEYLQETNSMADGQLTLAALSSGYQEDDIEAREREIQDIINRIIDKNDVSEIKKYADYRNYMSYEIIINNDEVKDGKLSKQVGYNSGAGTQIPYTLILSAALSMLYNVRVNSVRLIFIDEPFEKMSDHNIKLMLDFFKNQDFQVLFCAPPNKLESIGSECGVIIPVLKISNDNMQIGEVKFRGQ